MAAAAAAGDRADRGEGDYRVSSNPKSSSDLPLAGNEEDGDPQCEMVEAELFAARALADLAQSARPCREKSSPKRTKDGSPSRVRESKASNSKHAFLVADQSVKAIENSGLHSSISFCGRRMKENLSEADKEAKRIRRVLANRESARQTIRRRQALREELVQKVADLSLDNENMKTEMELVMKECLALKENNKQLKEQVAKKYVNITSDGEVKSSTASLTKLSLAMCNTAYIWPPDTRPWYDDEGNPSINGGSIAPFFVPPYVLFFPLIHQASVCCPLYSHAPHYGDHAAALGRLQDLNLCSTTMVDDVGTTEMNDNHGIPSSPRTMNLCSVIESAEVEDEAVRDQADTIMADETRYPRENLVDLNLALEARKRRKELRRLKHLHGRQIRQHR